MRLHFSEDSRKSLVRPLQKSLTLVPPPAEVAGAPAAEVAGAPGPEVAGAPIEKVVGAPRPVHNAALEQHIRRRIEFVISDAASDELVAYEHGVRPLCALLQPVTPNARMCIRDKAHASRRTGGAVATQVDHVCTLPVLLLEQHVVSGAVVE